VSLRPERLARGIAGVRRPRARFQVTPEGPGRAAGWTGLVRTSPVHPCRERFAPRYRRRMPSRKEVRDAFGDFLSTFNWDYFITVTFRVPRQPHHALGTVREVGKVIRRSNTGRLFLGTELHVNRTLHLHGLLEAHGRPNGFLKRQLWADLFDRFGRSQVLDVQSREAVSSYVSKYVVKGLTEWDIW